jgi:hypothetical protein
MTPPIVNALALAVNDQLDAAVRGQDDRTRKVKTEILRLEREAGNLVRFLAGGESFTVREELQSIEAGLQALRVELARLKQQARLDLPRASPSSIWARLEHLDRLLREDAPRARLEILKHLDGDLTILALPPEGFPKEIDSGKANAPHPFEIHCRIKARQPPGATPGGCMRDVGGGGALWTWRIRARRRRDRVQFPR